MGKVPGSNGKVGVIMIEKILERLEELVKGAKDSGNLSMYIAYNQTIDILKEVVKEYASLPVLIDTADTGNLEEMMRVVKHMKVIPVQTDGGWIPCEIEFPPMPKENPLFDNKPLELYLVTVKGADYPFRAFWNGEEFTDGWSRISALAWMPLPPKYEPKDVPYQKGEPHE